MKIGISGAGGQLGRAVLQEITAHHPEVDLVGISRAPDALPAGVEARQGDYDRPETLPRAYAGLDQLLLIPSSDLRRGVRAAQNIAAIDAAIAAGVKHIVLLSALGTRQQEEPAVGASYWVGEQHLIKNAPSWTILRMSYYAEAFAQEAQASAASGALVGLGESRVSYVSRGDIAAAAAGVLTSGRHTGAIYALTGPERLTSAQRSAAATSFAGKQVGFAVVTETQLREGMTQSGLPEEVVDAVVSIQRDFVSGAFDVVTGDVEHLSGRVPKTLEQVLHALSIGSLPA